jgi:accessory gene regulator B
MMRRCDEFSNRLLLQISENEDECEILCYGLHQILIITVNLLSVLVCGILWDELLFSTFLFLCLFFLRPYAGGYHADTESRCYVISVGVMNLAMVGNKVLRIPTSAMILIYFIMVQVIWKNAPLENNINPLTEAEKRKYSGKAKRIIIIYSVIAGSAVCANNVLVYNVVFYGIAITAFSVLVGQYKYY